MKKEAEAKNQHPVRSWEMRKQTGENRTKCDVNRM